MKSCHLQENKEPEDIMLSEISHMQKDKYYILFYMREFKTANLKSRRDY